MRKTLVYNTLISLTAAAALALPIAPAMAAGQHGGGHAMAAGQHGGGHAHGHAVNIGKPGHPSQAMRIIEIVLTENRFTPNRISIKQGETVRFVLRNTGEAVHEFNIGTALTHVAHRKEMETMVENGVLEFDRINHHLMKMDDDGGGRAKMHDDANAKLLEPGDSAEIVWTFSADAELEFACNVPGHYEAGMRGDIRIE